MSTNPFARYVMSALKVLDVMKDRGADLRNPRDVVFYFYGGPAGLPALQQGIERLGFAVRPTSTSPGRIARMDVAVNEAWLRDMIPKLCALAEEHGAEYDGWEASIPEAMP